MGEDRAEETSKRVRDSVKNAIDKITGTRRIRSDDAAPPFGGVDTTGNVTDQPNPVSEPRQ